MAKLLSDYAQCNVPNDIRLLEECPKMHDENIDMNATLISLCREVLNGMSLKHRNIEGMRGFLKFTNRCGWSFVIGFQGKMVEYFCVV